MRQRPQSFVMLPYQVPTVAMNHQDTGQEPTEMQSQLATAHELMQLSLGSRPMQYMPSEAAAAQSDARSRVTRSDQDLATALNMSMYYL
jgi:hypothetical protein